MSVLSAKNVDVAETMSPATWAAPGVTRVVQIRAEEATVALPRIAIATTNTGIAGGGPIFNDADFIVKGLLGEGGMGKVYLAHQRSVGRDVAIKVLQEGKEGDDLDRAAQMLLGEALITGSLEHPTIAPIHVLGTDANGRPVLVMKRIEGVPWSVLLSDPNHEAWSRIEPEPSERLAANVDILMRVCDGIHYAHSRGVIHRDIKPSNVMVGGYGEVYIVDWGIAMRMSDREAMAAEGEALTGTACFMAPEMALGAIGSIDERTDVYLLGATLHFILTGTARHTGKDLSCVLSAAVESAPVSYRGHVPYEIGAICNRACAAEPSNRFESVLALRRVLSDFLRHKSSVALCLRLKPRTEQLERLLMKTMSGESKVEPRALALLSECRFGYEQALREWPANPAGKEGLRRVLCVAIRLELAQGDAIGARAALGQLDELGAGAERGELERRIAKAEQHARARDAKLERLDRDTDLRVGARQRAMIVLALMPFVMGMVAFVLSSGSAAITHANMVVVILFMNSALWLAIARGRAKLVETDVNRRLVSGAAVILGIWLVNRSLGWVMHTPLNIVGASDLFVLAGIAGAAWAPQIRRFAFVSVLALGGAAGATHFADRWAAFFALTALVLLGTFASLFFVRRGARFALAIASDPRDAAPRTPRLSRG